MAKARTKKTKKKTTSKKKVTKKATRKKAVPKKTATKRKTASKKSSPTPSSDINTTSSRTNSVTKTDFKNIYWELRAVNQEILNTRLELKTVVDHIRAAVNRIGVSFPNEVPSTVPAPTSFEAKTTSEQDAALFGDTPDTGKTDFTKEDVAQALQQVMTVSGADEVKSILKAFKAKKVSDIKADDYWGVVDRCHDVTGNTPTSKQTTEANPATSVF